MDENMNILGFYVSSTMGDDDGALFRKYIWGEKGISGPLKKLNHADYGKDIVLILFQFYVNPIPYEQQSLKEIESYRKKEKSIGMPIIVNNKNFFNQIEEGRYAFLQNTILHKLEFLTEVVKKKKLDTRVDLLKSDLVKVFEVRT